MRFRPTEPSSGGSDGHGSGCPKRWLRLDLQFDGTAFLGWQRQPQGRTVQGVVEDALERVLGRRSTVVGAGRTDAGTHARHMVASTIVEHDIPASDLQRALDAVLPPDVGVRAVTDAREGFHALRDTRWKWYRYTLLTARLRRPLCRRTTWHMRARLDREVLDGGAAALAGRHDFQAFANTGSPRLTTVRTMHAVQFTDDDEEGLLHFDVVGDGFLYRMVRSMVGTLVHWARSPGALAQVLAAGSGRPVGEKAPGRRAATAVESLFETGDHALSGPVAPARGLCLMAVGGDEDPFGSRLPPFLLRAVESACRASSGGPP